MAYDEKLADRMRRALALAPGVDEKKMFGGVAFLKEGKMFCGIATADLMVRVGPEAYQEALSQPHARPMDFTGKPMMGYVFVAPEGVATEEALMGWIRRGAAFVDTLPKKAAPKRAASKKAAPKKTVGRGPRVR